MSPSSPSPLAPGWHNFHHTFPWDYATSEFGYKLNLSKVFIDAMALVGQAYDLKQAAAAVVMERRRRTGDLREQETQGREEEGHTWHEHEVPHPSDDETVTTARDVETVPSTSL